MYVRLKPCAGGADATGGSPDARFRVCVSAPLRYSDARIMRFIEERASWIREHAAKMQVRERDREINGSVGFTNAGGTCPVACRGGCVRAGAHREMGADYWRFTW